MPIISQGAPATLSLDVRNGSGDPVDPSSLTLAVNDSIGDPQAGFPVLYPGSIIKDSVGHYHYDWDVPALQPVGAYTAVWEAILLGAPEQAQEHWEVVASGSMSAGGLDFLQKPEDYDAIRGLLGVTTLDVEDTDIELQAFGPHAERLIKNRISNWATQMTDTSNLFVLRLSAVYQTACLMAESFVRGGTIGLVRPLSVGEGRDWADAAEKFCSRYEYWVNIADALDDPDASTAIYAIMPMRIGGPTSARISQARATGAYVSETDRLLPWWSFPPYWHEPRS